jgi:DNA-binding LacI/PurR family transcriptional regulator
MRDIATRAKVSIGTVSRVLNRYGDVDSKLRERVEAVARSVGYQLSDRTRNVVQAKSRIIGLVLLNDFGLSSAHSLLLLGVEEYCSRSGYHLLFARHRHAPDTSAIDVPSFIQTPGLADCVIVAGSIHANALRAFEDYGLKCVLLKNHLLDGAAETAGQASFVEYDDLGGCYQATCYLAQLGHKDIWYIGDESRPWDRNRLKGYARAMAELTLAPRIHTVALSDDEFEHGQAAAVYILEQGWPMTAILAASDQLAFGAREGLRQHRLDVPKDASLIGFEYEAQRGRASHLTSVSMDMTEVGRQLAKVAIAQIENEGKDNRSKAADMVMPALLVKRSTCRPFRREEHMLL